MPYCSASSGEVSRISWPFSRNEPESGRVDAGDDLHQRRFAGAVLAHQRVHMAALQAERDVVERQHAGKGLADVLDFEQIFGARNGAALADEFALSTD